MRRKYGDCQRADGNCALCSLVSYGRDCHGKKLGRVEWLRMVNELTQKELAEKSGVDIRKIQRIENEEIKLENITLGTARRLAAALGIDVGELV